MDNLNNTYSGTTQGGALIAPTPGNSFLDSFTNITKVLKDTASSALDVYEKYSNTQAKEVEKLNATTPPKETITTPASKNAADFFSDPARVRMVGFSVAAVAGSLALLLLVLRK